MELDKHREEVTAYYSGREHKPFPYIIVDEAHDLSEALQKIQAKSLNLKCEWGLSR